MKLDLFEKYEKSFLEAKIREWGWRGDDAKIFMGRMLSGNKKLSNVLLGEDLKLCNDNGDLIPNKVADTLNRNIVDVLRKAGCPEGDWKVARTWLEEEIFPKWVKPLAWQELWLLTEPNPGIVIEIVPPLVVGGSKRSKKYQPRQVPLDSDVRYQIPMAEGEYLILLERDGNGNISCLQPSPFQEYEVGEPIATSKYIAIVSPQKPAVYWWEDAVIPSDGDYLSIQSQQLEALMNWTNNARNDCRLWQFEVEIVESKSEAVAVSN
jgi:hypothetical protein